MMTVGTKYRGADWVKAALKVENMSPLGEEVANVLGQVFYGIYHMEEKSLAKVEWDNDHSIEILLPYRQLSTIDDNSLTALVVLSHDRMLRLSISAARNNILRLLFHQRVVREGTIHEKCPTIENHISQIRAAIGLGEA